LHEFVTAAIQGVHVAGLSAAWLRFRNASVNPVSAQRELLLELLKKNADTGYGQETGFNGIDSIDAFRARVPVVDYEAIEPWIERVAAGEPCVLTTEPVLMMEKSGGSTAANKLIPYTRELLDQFSRATGPWLCNLFVNHPSLLGTRSYWSVSPVSRERETTAGGIPVGFEDDTEYFGPIERWAIRRTMAVDSSVARIRDMEQWRLSTALGLLQAEDLGLVSVWSPTFLTRLMSFIEDNLEHLLKRLPKEREARIRTALDRDPALFGEALWPRLGLISCWADGASAEFIDGLRTYFPRTPIQPKGLLATEGVVSFPLHGHDGSVLALTSHFLEFIETGGGEDDVVSAHEIETGGEYSPVITTGGGLYRYHIKDVVRCVGRYHDAPLIRFVGKLDRVSDLVGEKINVRQVDRALDRLHDVRGLAWDFALLAPTRGDPPAYVLFIETNADDTAINDAARDIEAHLAEGRHYRYARDLGQLGPVRALRVEGGWGIFEEVVVSRGMRAGDVKPTHLDDHTGWDELFE